MAGEMRRAFDRTFTEAPSLGHDDVEDVLAIRLNGAPYAMRVRDVASVHADRAIVPVPGPEPALLGLAGIRSVIAPVYDLRLLLGGVGGGAPRWIVRARAPQPIALAFDGFDGQHRVARDRIVTGDGGALVREQGGERMRPIVDMARVLERVARLGGPR